MALTCEACGSAAVERDSTVGVAHCQACDYVFSLSGPQGDTAVPEVAALAKPPRAVVERADGDQLVLEVPWDRTMGFFALVAVVMMFQSSLAGILVAFSADEPLPLMRLVGLALVQIFGVGGVGYVALAYLLNQTTFHSDRSGLHVRVGPIPWRGKRDISAADLQQLYVVKQISHDRGGRVVETFDLFAQVAGSEPMNLLHGLPTAEPARYIERRFERWLGIQNVAVAGEHQD